MTQKTALTITFADLEDDETEAGAFLSLSLDAEANNDETTFTPGSKAFLRLMKSSADAYETQVSGGYAAIENTSVPKEETETITFSNSKTASLRYPPAGGVSYEWQGNNQGVPLFAGRDIILSDAVTGILQCTYTALGDRLSVEYDSSGQVAVTVIQGSLSASITVTFEDAEEEEAEEPVPYDLQVYDACEDDDMLTAVQVFLDGVYIGLSDSDGRISLGALIPGSEHDLELIKSGYTTISGMVTIPQPD